MATTGKLVFLLPITAAMLGLVSLSAAVPGTATYYNPPYVPSACYEFQDNGVIIAAASDAIWDNGAACGRRYSVTCTGAVVPGAPQPCRGSVVVTIVDYCPAGCQSTIDLSHEAFAIVADPDAGWINIEYSQV